MATPEQTIGAPASPAPRNSASFAWIDLGRILAIAAVVAIHVATPLVADPSRTGRWWTGNVFDSITRWSVPLFIMLSGALLLVLRPRDDLADFYRRRLARLGPPFVVWVVVYLVADHFILHRPAGLVDAVRLVAAGSVDVHLYFLFVIIGLYLVAPLLLPIVRHPDPRVLPLAVAVALVVGMANVGLEVLGIGEPNALTRWISYLGYFLAGAWLLRVATPRRVVMLAAGTVVLGMAATAIGTAILTGRYGPDFGKGRYLYEYLSITTVPLTLAMFVLFRALGPALERWSPGARGWLHALGERSFGVYLVHPLVLALLRSVGLTASSFEAPLAVLATVAVAIVISLGVVEFLRRIPWVRASVG
jgi:surface polysaccharide O-acyltransferase-like enzyme